MAHAIRRSGRASDNAIERVSAENLKAFVSRILTVPVAPFLEKSILLFIVYFGFATGSDLQTLESCGSSALDREHKRRPR